MKLFTFKGGVHPPENKEAAEHKAIEQCCMPKVVYIPLLQHIGTPLEPLVKVGDEVKIGQKIADIKAMMAVPVHASVSGKVKAIEVMAFPLSGFVKTIVIENDEKEEWIQLESRKNYNNLSKEQLLEIIREAGVVGQGGAAFPTHVKLNPPKDKKIDVLLLNGAECEPYLNADNRVMIEHSKEVEEGVRIAMKILGVEKAFIAIENNKTDAIEKMKKAIESDANIEVAVMKTKYPQGGEKQLIKAVLGRVVPSKKLPADVGVIVMNISTAKAIYDAVIKGKPLIERVLTVGGKGVKESKNILARIGTPFKDILENVNYDENVTDKLIMGGPMMGMAQYTPDVSVIKGTSGILALTKEEMQPYEPRNCIKCGRCVEVCPMGLLPLMYPNIAEDSQWHEMEKFNLMDCIECGACSYICPANRPLTEAIKIGKAKLRSIKK